jgi:hypothetical protein
MTGHAYMEENMTNLSRLSAALAATSIVVLSASAAHAVVFTPPRPTVSIPAVPRPTVSIPAVHPNITKPPVVPTHIHPPHSCKCIIPPHPPLVTNPYPHRPQIILHKPPVTTNIISTSSKPSSFGGKPVTANTTVSKLAGPGGQWFADHHRVHQQ